MGLVPIKPITTSSVLLLVWFFFPHSHSHGLRDDSDSKKRKQKGAEPWAAKKPRHDVPQYRIHLAPYAPDR